MSYIGFLFAFGATISWAIAAFPLTKASRGMPVNTMNHFRLLFGTVLITIAAVVMEQNKFFAIFSGEYAHAWFWLGASGIVALILGDALAFKSYTILSPQRGSILSTLSPASALIAGSILLDEHTNIAGIIGILITIAGVAGISLGRSQRQQIPEYGHGSIVAGIGWGVLSACCHGTGLALSKAGFVYQELADLPIGPMSASFIRMITGLVILWLITLLRGKLPGIIRSFRQNKEGSRLVMKGSIFNPSTAVICSMVAINYIDVAVAQTIFALVPLFALFIAHFFYIENMTGRSLMGVGVTLIGVAILIWRNEILLICE